MGFLKQIKTVLSFMMIISLITATWPAPASEPGGMQTVSIRTRTPCQVVEKIEQSKVFLISATQRCVRVNGRLQVEINAAHKTVQIYVDGTFWQEQDVQTIKLDDVNALLEQSEEIENSLVLPQNHSGKEAKEKAEALTRFFSSEGYQKRLREETARLKREVLNLPLEGSSKPEASGSGKGNFLSDSERIYLFISSAMPTRTLRNYAADLDRLGDRNISMVMRGFIGGMRHVKPTLGFVSTVIVRDPACRVKEQQCPANRINLQIDPLLFRKYKITRVPALVYVPSFFPQDQQASEGLNDTLPHYTLYGDASLEYLIETLYRDTQRESLKKILKSFTGD